jgi:hypothetical protein
MLSVVTLNVVAPFLNGAKFVMVIFDNGSKILSRKKITLSVGGELKPLLPINTL